MAAYWGAKKAVTSTADDTRTLSLHVLSNAGFGISYPFKGHEEKSVNGAATNYKDSLQTILDNCVLLFALGLKNVSRKWMPSKVRRVHQAVVNFQAYMTDVYEKEKDAISQGSSSNSRNLMSSLVRASQTHGDAEGLTESEIYGNMFVFNFAGHDTTAHTLSFAIFLLATQPLVQEWIYEEILSVMGQSPTEEWNYTNDFPRLKRCLAVMLETIRLYTPVPIAKSTGKCEVTLKVGEDTYVIPKNTLVIPNHVTVHTHPKYWGEDSLKWRPSRWITPNPNPKSTNQPSTPKDEVITTPEKALLIAWSEGLRVCPGKKFSQVEFVACVAVIFREWYVEPVVGDGETVEGARRRVLRLVEQDTAQVLLLQMLHPERAPLVWRRR